MNRKLWAGGFLALTFAGGAAWFLFAVGTARHAEVDRDNRSQSTKADAADSAVAQNPSGSLPPSAAILPSPNGSPNPDPQSVEAAKEIYRRLKAAGAVEQRPPADELKRAVSSHDTGNILRAFDEVLYRRRPSESIPAIRPFLKDPNPYVRYQAGQHLFFAGDDTGYAELLSLAQAGAPIAGIGKEDVRVSAARTLAKYHQTAAIDVIVSLFLKTKDSEIEKSLSKLGVQLPSEQQYPFVPSKLALEQYAESKDVFFSPQIASVFQNTKVAELKSAAAWSLATLTGDQQAVDYLAQQARLALAGGEQGKGINKRQTLKYLGTLQTPAAKQILEEALNDHDQVAVEIAITNLLYNQGGSEKAIQKIADQLADSSHATLSWYFIYDICAKYGAETVVQDAAKKFEQHDELQEWQRYVVDRRNWSIYNWIEDYVVKLNNQ